MKHHTSTSAAQLLGIPPGTIITWERSGVIGPFERDANGRRILGEKDIEQIRSHMAARGRPLKDAA